jgi:hypothetical protein
VSEYSEAIENLRSVLGAEVFAYQKEGQPWVCRYVMPQTIRAHLETFHEARLPPAFAMGDEELQRAHEMEHERAHHLLNHIHRERQS